MQVMKWILRPITLCLLSLDLSASIVDQHLPTGPCKKVVKHKYYSLCYSQEHRQATWTIHELTAKGIKTRRSRTNNFRPDSAVSDPVQAGDYRGSGFDRGHMAPAADMKITSQAMSESFFMTNMSPQLANFNRKIWAKLENDVRSLVLQEGDAIVVTAPVLTSSLPKIRSGVAIPNWYYKIIYIPSKNKMYAYLMPHKDLGKQSPALYAVSVDEIENITGYDFFSSLPNDLEDQLESQISTLN